MPGIGRDDSRSTSLTGDRRPVAVPVAVGIVVTILRAWTSRGRVMFGITPDEPGQLAIARFVSGLPRWNMFDHSTWRPLYGTVIAPLHWIIDDPTMFYEAAHVVNAALGGLAALLMYLLARRLTGLSTVWCGLIALVVSLAPAVLFTTNYLWAESLVSVVYPAALLALLRFYDRPTIGRGVMLAALSIAGYITHTRLLPFALVATGGVVLCVVQHRLSRRDGLVVLGSFAALYLLGSWYSEFLVDRIWETPSARNSYGGVYDQIKHVSSVFASLIGQVWYQLVTTAGLFGVGLVVVVHAARGAAATRDIDDGESSPDRLGPSTVDARLVMAAVTSLVALSVVFMTDRWRPDQVVYGRYNDAVVGPVLVIALGWLISQRRLATMMLTFGGVIATTLVTGVALNLLRADQLSVNVGVRVMLLGLQSFLGTASSIRPLPLTLAGACVAAVVALAVALSRRTGRRELLFVVLGVLMVVSYDRTRERVDVGLNGWQLSEAMAPVRDEILAGQTAIRIRFVPNGQHPTSTLAQQRQRRMVYQFYLPHQAMYTDGREPRGERVPYVFAPLGDPAMLADGAELVWRDPGVSIGLWFDP